MEENLKQLKKELERIKEKGYIKSSREGTTRIEDTFVAMLESDSCVWDYSNMEFKNNRGFTNNYLTIFKSTLEGEDNQLKRIRLKYGYTEKDNKNKVICANVQGNASTLVGTRILFKLEVDYEKERVYLRITDKNYSFVERKAYWSFASLEEKLIRKSKYLVILKAWIKYEEKVEYFKYYDMDMYRLKSLKDFLKLIEDGTIQVVINVDIYQKGPRKGELHDHGICFRIQELDLLKLYTKINI